MFTGIIESTGSIRTIQPGEVGATLTIGAAVSSSLKIGDSISVNGVCLTATRCGKDFFCCDLSPETLERSTFKRAKEGMVVNLERPLEVGSRLGGHFVQGHVDGEGRLVSSIPCGTGLTMAFEFPQELERYLVYKGSVAIDGISLTVATLDKRSFTVAVIPHTLYATNLSHLRIGDLVNLEMDLLGKYFDRFFQLGLNETVSKK